MAKLLLEVVTPEKTVLREEVDMAVCPGTEGEFGVLAKHVSLLSSIKPGALRYRSGSADHVLFISSGFVDVNNNICSVMAEAAERAEEIDVERAKKAKERAEKRLAEKAEGLDEIRAYAALERAKQRLYVAGL